MVKQLDIIIPIYNEVDNLRPLVERIDLSLKKENISYQIIFIDDHSTDSSRRTLVKLAAKYPVTTFTKNGKRGKAFSILEGAERATAPYVAMIDADLQYPPEVLPDMLRLTQQHGVVVARRNDSRESYIRKILSRGFRWVFGKVMYGLECDVQSGLKIFKREIISQVHPSDVTAWTLDIPLLSTALRLGFTIGQVDITFEKRVKGESKIEFVSSIKEIGGQAIAYKLKRKNPFTISPEDETTMVGAGLIHKGRTYITHTTLPHNDSALRVITSAQRLFLYGLLITSVIFLIIQPFLAAKIIVGILSFVYFIDVIFNLFLILKSLNQPPEIIISAPETDLLKDKNLPLYTILCPLYKEAHVLPHFLASIAKIDWPKNKLDVILLLEEDDQVTVDVAKAMDLPSYVSIRVVPDSQPKTKPKACNYGLHYAKGEYLVIYDAEDSPDPLQLKKVYAAFQKSPENIKCIQAKLNFYNPHQNLLTRFFTAEYSLWFDVVLTGLQSIQTSIPLGGTSNHFKTHELRLLEGWDPFNVTEDCDLGIRLFQRGGVTAVIDSITLEEANSHWGNWLRQRSRWIKGYMQTYLVHMRNPVRFFRQHGLHALLFQLVVGGKISFMLINPLMWLLTVSYFALYAWVGPSIEALYPSVVFYMAVTSLIFGNFMFLFYYMIGAAKREHWSIIKWVFLVPIYWLMVSLAALIALYELVRKPHYWQKTVHGLHLKQEEIRKQLSNTSKDVVAAVAAKAEIAEEVMTTTGLTNNQDMIRLQAGGSLWKPFIEVRERLKRIHVRKAIGLLKSPTYLGGVVLVGSALVANVTNMATNLYLGRAVDFAAFGLFNIMMSLFNLTSIPVGAMGATINYRASYLLGKHGLSSLQHFVRYMHNRALWMSVVFMGLWLILIPWLADTFAVNSMVPFVIFTLIWLANLSFTVHISYLNARLAFFSVAMLVLLQPFVRFASAAGLAFIAPEFIFLSILIGLIAVAVLAGLLARGGNDSLDMPHEYHLSRALFVSNMMAGLSTIAFFSLDNLLVAHYFEAAVIGQYALMGLFGKMVFFIGTLISPFLTPLVARREGAGKNSQLIFSLTLLGVSLLTIGGYVAFIGGGVAFGSLIFGDKMLAIRELLPLYGIGVAAFTVSQVIVNYHVVKKHALFSIVALSLAVIQILALIIWHSSLAQVTQVMTVMGILHLLVFVLLHSTYARFIVPLENVRDFLDLFAPWQKTPVPASKTALRVLILNWRDTKHVWAGGAEVYVHGLSKELLKRGHRVTVFCGNDGHAARNEVIDGVQMVRRGGFYTVYFWAAIYYVLRFRGTFDVIIDSENGIPFLSPLYARIPTLLLMHHVHQEVFRTQLKFPFKQIALAIEGVWMPLVYRNHRIITVSPSTYNEVLKLGITEPNLIEVIPPGAEVSSIGKVQKTKHPSICYIGRLQTYKNLDTALYAFARVLKVLPTARLTIAGYGIELSNLKRLAKKLEIESAVVFAGRISDEEKAKLYASHWLAVQPSSFEGWGMTVIEANRFETPVVASNVMGLRDSVVDGKTGSLVRVKDPDAMANEIIRLCKSPSVRKKLALNAKSWSQRFTWEAAAIQIESLFKAAPERTTASRGNLSFAWEKK